MKTKVVSKEQFITALHCTKEQYDEQMTRCRAILNVMRSKAQIKGRYRGYTAAQLDEILKTY